MSRAATSRLRARPDEVRLTIYLPRAAKVIDAAQADAIDSEPSTIGAAIACSWSKNNDDVDSSRPSLLEDLGYTVRRGSPKPCGTCILAEDEFSPIWYSPTSSCLGMNGVELCRRHSTSSHPGLPVVLTSGYSNVLADKCPTACFETHPKPYSGRVAVADPAKGD